MTLATVKTVITRFLHHKDPQVIAIKGPWGGGKTYAWQKLIEDNRHKITYPTYSYVSLFGISSIAQLRTAIFTKGIPVKMIGQNLNFDFVNKNWTDIVSQKFKSALNFSSQLSSRLSQGRVITVGLETIAPFLISNSIICLDDFERLSQNSISTEELLGFICELREERNCKVVLIFNEAQLGNPSVYSKYREKVIDIEVLYDPTPLEATNLALPPNLPFIDDVKKYCNILEIKNIRVLKKIVALINEIHPQINNLHQKVQSQAIHTGVVLSCMYYENDANRPTIDFLMDWNRVVHLVSSRNNDEVIVNQNWVNLLNSYGVTEMDEFDKTILKVIERGFIEETGFIETANQWHHKYVAYDLDQSFSDAWKLYHNTFANNEAELAFSLITSLKKSVDQVNPMNLSGTTMLLRFMEKDDDANELIEYYVNTWIAEKRNLDLKLYPFSDDIKDPIIWKIFEDRAKEKDVMIPLNDIASSIIDDSISKVEMRSLHTATIDDFYDLFNKDHGENLTRLITGCLRFLQYSPEVRSIGEKAHAALVKIGKENRLNSRRVKKFNINIDFTNE